MDIKYKHEFPSIAAISLKGFKSFAEEQRLEIRPLTLLAGANSSGKSSALQPLLLLKQTLEAGYDPGPLLLHDSHVRFTSADQVLTKLGRSTGREFEISVELDDGQAFRSVFRRQANKNFDLVRTTVRRSGKEIILEPGQVGDDLEDVKLFSDLIELIAELWKDNLQKTEVKWRVVRRRCFLDVALAVGGESDEVSEFSYRNHFVSRLRSIFHVPGLRGNPSRTYRRTAAEGSFPGSFEVYVATLIAAWQEHGDKRLEQLCSTLEQLGLTSEVRANPVDAAHLELLVGRLPKRRKGLTDLVNIADVGFGVSQVVPVLVALLTARPGQLVYLEQPELHLHPRAQEALASVLADAANRGVQVVAETHSSLLLLAVQTLAVEGKLSPDKVKLHWFQRDARGATRVHSADLDNLGAYGDWPEDFGQVFSNADHRYLNAVEAQVFPAGNAKR